MLKYNDAQNFFRVLRRQLKWNQTQIAKKFGVDRSRISHYENWSESPSIGYMASLARLVVQEEEYDDATQAKFLVEINKAAKAYHQEQFEDWGALETIADEYLSKRKPKRSSKRSSKTPAPMLKEPDLQEPKIDERWQEIIRPRLPARTYRTLFGIDNAKQKLNKFFAAANQWLLMVQGPGGIGKTTLVHSTIQTGKLSQYFQGFAWISAQQQAFQPGAGTRSVGNPRLNSQSLVDLLMEQVGSDDYRQTEPTQKRRILQRLLGEKPHLIVLDNLETVEDIQALMPTVRELSNPSKFVLTSRDNLASDEDVERIRLTQLVDDDAIALMKEIAQQRESTYLAEISKAELQPILDIVGGNPLALKLVVAQIDTLSLEHVTHTLKEVPNTKADRMYSYLYKTSWQQLMPESQRLLAVMPLTTLATVEQLITIAQLELYEFLDAMPELVQYSLVEVSGDVNIKRYSIHRLTETFLQKPTIRWRYTDSEPDALDVESYQQFFHRATLKNLSYWCAWMETHGEDIDALDVEREGIVKGIRVGLDVNDGWGDTYELISSMMNYMERNGYWDSWYEILKRSIEIADQHRKIVEVA
ncbi:MAG: NB-ARC domain-containing protein, partial [Chloroflexota bacterium]